VSAQNIEVVSNFGPAFFEALNGIQVVSNLFVDRIIAHRKIISDLNVPPELLDPSVYVPWLPCDTLPDLRPILQCGLAFSEEGETVSNFLRADGVFTLPAKCAPANDHERKTEPDEKIEFLIKWRGLPASEATWEPQEALFGSENEPFAIANIAEFEALRSLYFTHAARSAVPPQALPVLSADQIGTVGRSIELTADQKLIIEQLTSAFSASQGCHVATGPESGRVLAVVAFVRLLKDASSKPVLVICKQRYLDSWIDSVKLIGGLTWTDYFGTQSDRLIMRHHEFQWPPAFDLLITGSDIYTNDVDFLMTIEWGMVISDRVDQRLPLPTMFTVHISDSGDPSSLLPNILSTGNAPPSFSQEILFVPHLSSAFVHSWLKSFLKMKGIRQSVSRAAGQALAQLGTALLHPFHIKQFETSLIVDHQRSLGLADGSLLSQSQVATLFNAVSGKLQCLPDLLRSCQLSAIVGLNFAILRTILFFLRSRGIPSAMLNSNTAAEQVSADFTAGALLITRDFHSPLLDRFWFDQVVVYDIGFSFPQELNLLRFLTRRVSISVYRLMTACSVEPELFLEFISRPQFKYLSLDNVEADPLVRIAAVTSRPGRVPTTPPSVSFSSPGDYALLREQICSARSEIEVDDFWSNVFVVVKPPKSPKDSSLSAKHGMRVVSLILSLGPERASEFDVGVPPETAVSLTHSILLGAISQLDAQQLPFFNLASAIIWLLIFGEPYPSDFGANPGIWAQRADDDGLQRQPLFKIGALAVYLRTKFETFLRELERNWVIRAFLEIHDGSHVPSTFMLTRDPPADGAEVRALLEHFLAHGEDWAEIAARLPGLSVDVLKAQFPQLYGAIFQDLFLRALREPVDRRLLPIAALAARGPFLRAWTEPEHQCIVKALFNFGVPLNDEMEFDWPAFHALSRLTTKSTDAVRRFTTAVIDRVAERPDSEPLVIPPDQLRDGPPASGEPAFVLQPHALANLHGKLNLLKYVRQLAIHPPPEFRNQVSLPEGWTLEHDRALIDGICQFGFARVAALPAVVVGQFDDPHAMQTSLAPFPEFLADQYAILHRIKIIVVANCTKRRKLSLWAGQVRHVAFFLSEPIAQKEKVKRRERAADTERPAKAGDAQRGQTLPHQGKAAQIERAGDALRKEAESAGRAERADRTARLRRATPQKIRKNTRAAPAVVAPEETEEKPAVVEKKVRPTRVIFSYDTLPTKIVFVE
jgi:hypothetical protein